jgi:hypothetical protein
MNEYEDRKPDSIVVDKDELEFQNSNDSSHLKLT